MIRGRGEAETEEPVCYTAEGRRDRSSICLSFVVNVVDDMKRRKSWFSWDDGEREIRLDGFLIGHDDAVINTLHHHDLPLQFL